MGETSVSLSGNASALPGTPRNPSRVYDPGRIDARETRRMSRTHGRLGGTDEHAEFDGTRRPETHPRDPGIGRAPALTTAGDPRLAGHTAPAAGLLALQRSAGNAAVTSLVGARSPVQRAVTIEEVTGQVEGPPAPGSGSGEGGAVTSDGATTTITGGTIELEAPMTQAHGILRADTIIADNVVASSYTPGAGNVW